MRGREGGRVGLGAFNFLVFFPHKLTYVRLRADFKIFKPLRVPLEAARKLAGDHGPNVAALFAPLFDFIAAPHQFSMLWQVLCLYYSLTGVNLTNFPPHPSHQPASLLPNTISAGSSHLHRSATQLPGPPEPAKRHYLFLLSMDEGDKSPTLHRVPRQE